MSFEEAKREDLENATFKLAKQCVHIGKTFPLIRFPNMKVIPAEAMLMAMAYRIDQLEAAIKQTSETL